MHLIDTTLGWMRDIDNRLPKGISWSMTSQHRKFIELVENDDGNITFEQWREASMTLMEFHAMARNDIYDLTTCEIKIDADGHEQAEWETVSRQERDVRSLLFIYHTEYGDEEE